MPTGTIKKIIEDKGFGFITVEGSSDVFFHTSACREVPFDSLREGQTVEFEMGSGPKGPKAENVRPAGGADKATRRKGEDAEAEFDMSQAA